MATYIKHNELLNFGISHKTIEMGLTRYRQKKSRSWANIKDPNDKRKVLIDLDTIPEATRKKYGVPTGKEYQEQRLQQYEAEQERQKIERYEAQEREKTILASNELQALRNAYYNQYIQYIPLYKEYYAGNKKIDHYTKLSAHEHAFFLEMIHVTGGIYRGEWGKAEQGFNHYRLLTKELNFNRGIHNLDVFRCLLRDLRACLSVGKSIVDVIGFGKTGKRPELQTYNDFHRGLILFYMGHQKKYSSRLCADLINEHCADENQKPINESYIKWLMSNDNEFRTRVMSIRNGKKYLKDMILPHAVRYPVEFPANLWMIDGTPLQMYCVNEKGETIRLNLFIVLDVFSRKIVGFDVAFFEDKFMVMNALKMAVQDEGHLPKEILSDNFSANKTDEIIAIKEQMAKLEVNWRLAKVGNPQDKAQVERAFGVLQSEIFTFFNDYFGEGIESRRDNRPNKEFLAIHTKKPISINEMKSRICDVVALYNEQKKRTRPSPIELYKLPKPNAVEMTILKTALMFWTRTKHTIIQGMVKITVNKVQHIYEIKSHKIKMQLQGVQVYVRYDANDLDRVMLFDIENENVICECKKSIKIYIESDKPKDNLFKHTAKVKSYDDHLNKEWDNIKDKGLDKVGKDQIDEYTPFSLKKNQIHSQENKALAEMHKIKHFGLTEDIHKPAPKPRKVITKSNISTYEDIIKKEASKEASFKPVNAPTEN